MTEPDSICGPPAVITSATSKEAAEKAAKAVPTQRIKVLRCIREAGERGRTDEEIQEALDMNPSTQRPRRLELQRGGLVVDSGERRATKSGRKATVWIAKASGEQLRLRLK